MSCHQYRKVPRLIESVGHPSNALVIAWRVIPLNLFRSSQVTHVPKYLGTDMGVLTHGSKAFRHAWPETFAYSELSSPLSSPSALLDIHGSPQGIHVHARFSSRLLTRA